MIECPYKSKIYYSEEDQGFCAEFPDIPHVIVWGKTKEEALKNLIDVYVGISAFWLENGITPPEPKWNDLVKAS